MMLGNYGVSQGIKMTQVKWLLIVPAERVLLPVNWQSNVVRFDVLTVIMESSLLG
jgi:hypothetical protein